MNRKGVKLLTEKTCRQVRKKKAQHESRAFSAAKECLNRGVVCYEAD